MDKISEQLEDTPATINMTSSEQTKKHGMGSSSANVKHLTTNEHRVPKAQAQPINVSDFPGNYHNKSTGAGSTNAAVGNTSESMLTLGKQYPQPTQSTRLNAFTNTHRSRHQATLYGSQLNDKGESVSGAKHSLKHHQVNSQKELMGEFEEDEPHHLFHKEEDTIQYNISPDTHHEIEIEQRR